MAGNNAIQILRANSATIANSSETLLDGQLLYNTDKNYLTCGGGTTAKLVNSLPIVCRELVAYAGDDDTIGRTLIPQTAYVGLNNNQLKISSMYAVNMCSTLGVSVTGSSINLTASGAEVNIVTNGSSLYLHGASASITSSTATNILASTSINIVTNAPSPYNYGARIFLDNNGVQIGTSPASNGNIVLSGQNLIGLTAQGATMYLGNYFSFYGIRVCAARMEMRGSSNIALYVGTAGQGITINSGSDITVHSTTSTNITFPSKSGEVALVYSTSVSSNLNASLGNGPGTVYGSNWSFIPHNFGFVTTSIDEDPPITFETNSGLQGNFYKTPTGIMTNNISFYDGGSKVTLNGNYVFRVNYSNRNYLGVAAPLVNGSSYEIKHISGEEFTKCIVNTNNSNFNNIFYRYVRDVSFLKPESIDCEYLYNLIKSYHPD